MARMNAVIHDMEAEIHLGDTMRHPALKDPVGRLTPFDLPFDLLGTACRAQRETELGPHWRVVRLGEVASFKNGINFGHDARGSGILMIVVLNMYTDNMHPNLYNLYRVKIDVNSDYLLESGDLLFVRSSLKEEGVGWTTLFPGYREPVTFCGLLIRGRLQDREMLPEFLVNFLRLPLIRRLMVSKSGKVAITNISQGNLKAISVPLPPLAEQQEIARILQAVDEKIRAEKARKAAPEGLFRSLLHHLMSAKIRLPNEFVSKFQENGYHEQSAVQKS